MLAVALALQFRITATGMAVDLISGFFSGVLSTITGTNRPPLVIGLSGRRLPAAQQRATLSTWLAVGNVIVFITALRSNGRINATVAITSALTG